ncbi:hypothetical protein DQ353_07040 [Arthrobacter sp. AQ5-05]|nr:hypothetical protein DQ353_07040 [Arthrobacter sp. AQ5-05]
MLAVGASSATTVVPGIRGRAELARGVHGLARVQAQLRERGKIGTRAGLQILPGQRVDAGDACPVP